MTAEVAPRTVRCRIGARGVTRAFGPVTANQQVDLSVLPGTVHAVVGENGAGKSTLMRLLYGLDRPDDGTVVVDDEPVRFDSPRDAIQRGIGLVQQELAVMPGLTLLENLVLANEPRRLGVIDWRAARTAADGLAREVGVTIDWNADAAHTPLAVQQQVEILRLMHRGADVLILDEPTAVLAPPQVVELLALLRRLAARGRSVVFISHKLDEILEVADEITVLRGGRAVGHATRGELDRDGLARLIVGEGDVVHEAIADGAPGAEVLTLTDLSAVDDRGVERLRGAALGLRRGEILGIAGVAGNGQEELAEAVIGIRQTRSGRVVLDGRDITGASPRQRRAAGIAYVSADRKQEGLALDLSVAENLVAGPAVRSLSRFGWLRPRALAAFARDVLTTADVRFGGTDHAIASLSGGNQQRVVLERELQGTAIALVASQPTRGVDIRGIAHIHRRIRQARNGGTAVLLFSEELDELLTLSDRVAVLRDGRVVAIEEGPFDRARIGALMVGQDVGVAGAAA